MEDKKFNNPDSLREMYYQALKSRLKNLPPDEGLTKYAPPNDSVFGRGIIEKGKTKKFRMYEKGFTYKSIECFWEDVNGIRVSWRNNITSNGIAAMSAEALKIDIFCKEGIINIKFRLYSFLIPLDWTNRNETLVSWLMQICSLYNIKYSRLDY